MKRFFQSLRKKKESKYVELIDKQPSAPTITWQYTWSFDEIHDALLKSVFAEIPNEILLRIFKFLSVRDLCNISLVCRSFKIIADQDEIWKLKCNTSTKLYSKSFKQMYMDSVYMKCLRKMQLRRKIAEGLSTGSRIRLPPPYPTRSTVKNRFEIIDGFHRHPNVSSSMTIELSVDIEKTARELIKLYEKASKFQQQSDILKQMITRYYRFMQLKAFHPSNILLVPTLDIEIVWQTHLLRPEMYQTDCMRLFHRVIDHSLLVSDIEKFLKDEAFQDTCQLYEQTFGEPYCPLLSTKDTRKTSVNFSDHQFNSSIDISPTYSYWDKTHFDFSSESSKNYENPFSFTESDLIIDGKWIIFCKKFMSNALKNALHNEDQGATWSEIDLEYEAMQRLKKSYERFLYIASKYPLKDQNSCIRPTYAIDIMWCSHMQEPLNYAADCVRLVGYVIYHVPLPMIEDNTMKTAYNQMNKIWKDEFKVDIMTDHLYNRNEDS